ncbi:hypothetical protein [Bacillus sp. AFS040349]|uniref:hypothetical protein n=1 Tax=Bacillus sp. AFS040349 TaxID=2033502 RepID=UPI000BFD470E|nr:hypothetical protein [Bacillus sp. AFS040349]PGT81570.1 hypothetical protein COD11_17265 [Bacillus sp. AFS040349]
MKDYFYYKVSYEVGALEVEFDEFFCPALGTVTEEEAHNFCYSRALIELAQKGIALKSFHFERSSELALRRWETERVKEQELKTSLERSVKDAQSFNHGGE